MQKSTTILPLCTAIVKIQKTARKRDLEAQLEFLRLGHPNEVEFLMEHLPKVEAVMADGALLKQVKTAKTRAAKLADIFAGLAFGLSPQYAMQQAMAARRNTGSSESEMPNLSSDQIRYSYGGK